MEVDAISELGVAKLNEFCLARDLSGLQLEDREKVHRPGCVSEVCHSDGLGVIQESIFGKREPLR